MKAQQDKKELLRFMGMVNYLGKFIPNLSNVTQPLRELLKKETAWHWIETHEQAFKEIKKRITDEKILKYYEVAKPVTISGDSSSYGLGACLMQNGRPISYASRSLSKSEENYAQIEKELLAIVFGCTKFHQYIYAKPVTIETAHKPLEYLFRKPLTAAPPRLQRMMLALQKYDLHVIYKPGKILYIADTLSRAPGTLTPPEVENLYQVHTVQHLPVSPQRLAQFHAETITDPVLQKLQHIVHVGWPSDKSTVEPDIRDYWSIRDEISVQDEFLLRGERLIVPTSLRREMLSIIHDNHLGIEKCKRRVRDVLYWPGMNDQITHLVKRCETCQSFRSRQQKEPMKGHTIPDRPWQKVALHLFELQNENYLVITDYFSKFFEVTKLPNTTSASIIKHLKPHFARYGIPEEVISDNGPQLSSAEFANFAKTYQFKHTTSSPYYPQANGLAERTVRTAKSILLKARKHGNDPNIALLDYRNTPISGVGESPVQMIMGRRTRTLLPTSANLLQPKFNTHNIKSSLEKKQAKQKHYYDRSTRSLEPLKSGDQVRLRDAVTGIWIPAIVK